MSDAVPSRASQLNAIFISFTVITVLFVALRLWIRISRRTLGADDYVLVFATIASVVQTVFAGIATLYGYGKPFKSLSKHDQVYSLLMFWICQLSYKCVTWPTKVSVLLLYRRIFGDTPGIRAWGLNFNWTVKVYLALICVTFVCVEIVTIFACIPIARSWDKTIPGGCVQLVPWWYSYGAMNIFTDLTVLLLPMPLIQRLEIPARQKAGLFAIFGLGGFVCICTIVRITTIDRTSKSPDPTYGGVTTLIWTAVESNVGIICACLPLFRPIIVYVFPRFARTITKGGSYARHTGGDSRPKNNTNNTSQTRTMTENEPYTWRNWGKDENIIMTGVTAKRSNSTDSDIAINDTRDGITKVTHFHMTSEAASDTLSRKLDRESTLDDGRDLGDSQDSLNLPRQAV